MYQIVSGWLLVAGLLLALLIIPSPVPDVPEEVTSVVSGRVWISTQSPDGRFTVFGRGAPRPAALAVD